MNVCLITTAQPVDYSRFFHREAATLAGSGYDVTVVGLPSATDPTPIPGVTLRPVNLPAGIRKQFALGVMAEAVRRTRPGVCHCFDPWALRIGLAIKRRNAGVKVVYDSTELFPAVYRDRPELPGPVRAAAAAAVRSLERRAVREADVIIETNATRAARFAKWGREPVLVHNYPPRPTGPPVATRDVSRVVYTGMVTRERGFPVLLEAFADVAGRVASAQLLVIGRFDPRSDVEARSADFVRTRALASRLCLQPWLPYEQMALELDRCGVGVILLQPGRENDRTGQPNKLFDFMAAGLAVLASDFPEIGPLIRQERCGVTVNPTDARAVSAALVRLLADPEATLAMGRRGRAAVEREYNWDVAAARLIAAYDEMLGTRTTGRQEG